MAHLSHVHSGLIASPIHTLGSAIAGTHAAAQWLSRPAPHLSLAEYREARLLQLPAQANPHNVMSVTAVFRQPNALCIAAFIGEGNHHG